MHIVSGNLRKAPFVKQLQDSTMFAVELVEVIKDYKTGEKSYTNYKALMFAKSPAHIAHYNSQLVEGNFIVLTSEKLKIEVSDCGKFTKLFMDNARLENCNYIESGAQQQQQQPAQQSAGWGSPQQPAPQQQSYAPKPNQHPQQPQNPQQGFNEPSTDFDSDIPF